MARQKAVVKKELVAVYFTPDEIKQLSKKSRKELLGLSPFLRRHTIQSLNIAVEV